MSDNDSTSALSLLNTTVSIAGAFLAASTAGISAPVILGCFAAAASIAGAAYYMDLQKSQKQIVPVVFVSEPSSMH